MSVVKCLLDNTPLCKDVILIIEDYRIEDYTEDKKIFLFTFEKKIQYIGNVYDLLYQYRIEMRQKHHYALRDKIFGDRVYSALMDDINYIDHDHKRILGFYENSRKYSTYYSNIDEKTKNIYYVREKKKDINLAIRKMGRKKYNIRHPTAMSFLQSILINCRKALNAPAF